MNTTTWILIMAASLLISWDVYAVVRWGYTATISYDILNAAYKYPIIPFGFGIIMGHLFWPQ